jgi:hypothetical protein
MKKSIKQELMDQATRLEGYAQRNREIASDSRKEADKLDADAADMDAKAVEYRRAADLIGGA